MIVIEQPREVGQPRRKVWCNKADLTAQGEGYVFNDLAQDALGFGSIVFVVDEPGLVLWYDSESGEMYERVLGGSSITLETLSVTSNDNYTAPEGTAYNIVNVNVPNPSTGSLPIDKNGTYDVTDYAEAVVNVPTGGGGGTTSNDVNFIDYDGTIVYSYSASEFAALTSMPDNPTHDGLTAQGWNWSLSDAQSYVADYGFLTIGQMYITSDGKTRIYIHLEKGRLEPYLGICVNGTATVDWGDGTTSTVTGTSTTTAIYTQHVYTAGGDYVIAIGVVGALGLPAASYSNGSYLIRKSTDAIYNSNTVYLNAVSSVCLGENIEIIGNDAFAKMANLKSVTMPNYSIIYNNYVFFNTGIICAIIPTAATSFGSSIYSGCTNLKYASIPGNFTTITDNTFNNCRELVSLSIPVGVSTIPVGFFQTCNGLAHILIPSGITAIFNNALQCAGLGELWFYPSVPPTVSGSAVFSSIPTDCKIYVPAGSLEAYTTATNYPSSSTYTYVEY